MTSSSLPHCVILALFSYVMLTSYCVIARSLDADASAGSHTTDKRFYIPVIISSDAIMASLKDGRGRIADAPNTFGDGVGLERKRTADARLEYLDSLIPRSVEPKRKMFFSPLGYMSASARRLNQNNAGERAPSSKEDAGSPGFRYG